MNVIRLHAESGAAEISAVSVRALVRQDARACDLIKGLLFSGAAPILHQSFTLQSLKPIMNKTVSDIRCMNSIFSH